MAGERVVRADQCVWRYRVCRGSLPWLPLIEDVDHPPLEVLSPKDWRAVMAAAPGRVTWGDPLVVAMSDYDDKLAVG